ncbi:MAG: FAD-dependent monooxygenase [Chloroflexi bacterium]|nr:FAD-dependent monooxygenase [Chloroflexota bacterium]MBV9892568.1 FAD-dependent monooxygenase [Chloroflexota bacterium]
MERTYDVAIVGGGPVGVGLAVELGQRGVSTVLVERHLSPQPIPKGQSLTNRTLEHFYFWHCVDELRAARVMPPGYPIGGVTVYRDLTSPYFHAGQAFSGRGSAVRDFYFQANERLPQYCTEAVLRNRLKQLPSVETRFGQTAIRVEQDEETANLTIVSSNVSEDAFYSWSADTEQQINRDASGQTLRAKYVVGCDGGKSLVRQSMGIDRGGRNFDQRMVLAVFRSKELHEFLNKFPPSTTYRVMKPELQGYWQFFGRIDVGEGFFFHAPVPRDATPDNFDFLGLLHEAAGFSFNAEFDHIGFWDLRVMVASQYRLGRTFIAGDACHQHPPYGGFGLNTGLEDAVNLGWKLAATLQGWGGQRLLDSYDQERRPIFQETGEVMIAGGIDQDRRWLERYNPDRDRAEFERAWAEYGATRTVRPQSYEPHYEGSSVVMGPAGGVCSIHGRMSLRAEAGHHLAPRQLSNGRNVYEELSDGFTLLALDADDTAVRTLESAANERHMPLKVVRDSYADGREAYSAHLVLVRPDQYVVWAGDMLPSDTTAMIERVAGQ